jgi:hypothetical protein
LKKSQLIQIIREEISAIIKEYGQELIYFSPMGVEQTQANADIIDRKFEDFEAWKVNALQKGATVTDRGDDWIAVMPNQDLLGKFDKATQMGNLTY